jgi:hypothetical protein
MSPNRSFPAHARAHHPLPAILLACLLACAAARGDDRFFVPVAPSGGGSGSSSGGGGSSGSSGGGGTSGGGGGGGAGGGGGGSYTGGGGSSDSGSSGSGHGDSSSSGGRFFVPMPSRSNGGHGGGGGGSGGGYWNDDPYWGGCYYSGGGYHYWPGYSYPYGTTYTIVHRMPEDPYALDGPVVFFPPEPPPLDTPRPDAPPQRGHEIAAPPELSSFLTTSFYPQLSTRLHLANLSARQLEEIAAYRAERAALLGELRERLAATRSLPPMRRARELESHARTQAARLDALAAREAALRTSLLRGGLIGAFGGSGDWNQGRRWRLGTSQSVNREQTLGLEFRVVRAAAFYQDGLSREQRGLLREVAMELQAEAYGTRSALLTAAADESLVYFSPAGARVRFARDLPPSLTAKIAEFRASKQALKAELRDIIYTRDAESRAARTSALSRLSEDQEVRIQALELLADEIRLEVAGLGRPVRSPPPPLPPADLAARIAALRAEREYLQIELLGELGRLRSAGGAAPPLTATQVREHLEAFRQTNKARYAELATMQQKLRRDLAAHFATGPRPVSEASIDAWLNARSDAETPAALWQRYGDYADAVFVPGLSPEQRQLLFDGALEQLSFPLPAGERMP